MEARNYFQSNEYMIYLFLKGGQFSKRKWVLCTPSYANEWFFSNASIYGPFWQIIFSERWSIINSENGGIELATKCYKYL